MSTIEIYTEWPEEGEEWLARVGLPGGVEVDIAPESGLRLEGVGQGRELFVLARGERATLSVHEGARAEGDGIVIVGAKVVSGRLPLPPKPAFETTEQLAEAGLRYWTVLETKRSYRLWPVDVAKRLRARLRKSDPALVARIKLKPSEEALDILAGEPETKAVKEALEALWAEMWEPEAGTGA